MTALSSVGRYEEELAICAVGAMGRRPDVNQLVWEMWGDGGSSSIERLKIHALPPGIAYLVRRWRRKVQGFSLVLSWEA
jgi:hypothetical protein